jgi:photosystem II stability/assembly factor-like uncharacterized protein
MSKKKKHKHKSHKSRKSHKRHKSHKSRKSRKTLLQASSQPRRHPRIASGAPKKRLGQTVSPRLTLHKNRSEWFQARATWPLREADVDHVVSERARHPPTPPAAGTGAWVDEGPSNIGGRATALACDPRNEKRLWLGAAGGGVWFTADGGHTWTPQWHSEESLNIGSLAIDPHKPDTLYCGTGEANLSVDSYPGVGLFKTEDGGHTWKRIAEARDGTVPPRIGTIAIDPFVPDHIMVGGIGYEHSSPARSAHGGLYSSHDGGRTWRLDQRILAGRYWCHSIVFSATETGVVFAAVTANGTASGLYRSADGGQTWKQLTAGLPPPDQFGRAALAVSPSHPKRIYAIAADYLSKHHDKVLGVFRSDDEGTTWQPVAGKHFDQERQMSYGCAIAVHPRDPDVVVCGGVDLHRTTTGGGEWTKITVWTATRDKSSHYAHADHHALLMPKSRPGLIYDANDGGLDVSVDSGTRWKNRSKGLATIMFYDFDVAQSDDRFFGGGAQDNGVLITQSGKANQYWWPDIIGDGGWIVFDPKDPTHVFASFNQFSIFRLQNLGAQNVSPHCPAKESNAVRMTYVTLDPKDANKVLVGSRRVWRTTNDGATWRAVSPVLDDSPISAIEIAPSDSNRFFVGTHNGSIFRSSDAGKTWSANIAGDILPGRTVTRIDAHPTDPEKLFVCVAGSGCSHVFYSGDAGTRWQDIDRGRLPDVPHHAVLVRPDNPNEVYVASDAGVFVTTDLGENWRNISDNLPTSMYVDLVYRNADRRLFAATYGRGAWARVLSEVS